MRLTSVTVTNYRSITKAHRLSLRDYTILIGPNNEGKSNILRAVVVALTLLTYRVSTRSGPQRPVPGFIIRRYYRWERDYPKGLQDSEPDGESIFRLDFDLDAAERDEFEQEVGRQLTGALPLEICLGRKSFVTRVVKRGPGGGKLFSAKSATIASFLSRRIDFDYIPAVRTAKSALDVVEKMVKRELFSVEQDSAYEAAVDAIAALQQPILDKLANSIQETLVQFLPAITDVRITIEEEERYEALRRACKIVIDDGTPTELEDKGDGVQSLAALGIMRHASERGARGKNLIVAIEEPESHLHPNAIHELKSVIGELASKHQLLISTHCPLFVNRRHVSSNVIVSRNRAKPATTIAEIRDILGVRASDNLRHAELVLVVEGNEDAQMMRALLSESSSSLSRHLSNSVLAVDFLGGGTNLAYKVSLLREALCEYHCFLDNDSAALRGFERARTEGLVDDSDVNFATCLGMKESEIEDLIDPDLYSGAIMNTYCVSVDSPRFKSKHKWSVRMANTFTQQGKPWSDRIEGQVKQTIAALVMQNPANALLRGRRDAFDALARVLEDRLKARREPRR